MPTPGSTVPWRQASQIMDRFVAEELARPQPSLADEIAELRKEIAALRAELAPVPSLIITGRQALNEFKRLSGREA